MIEIIVTIFNSILHSLQTLVNIIVSIPNYVESLFIYVNILPSFILVPLTIALIAIVIIHIKRLVF